ncbi:alpha/beta fold hydrolase [uncultured Eubacterium sp.]|uniref:alpha/beta fold hydrolase n=1 Tax=uncultured Eubacterium sp. TaxID=165185 RepID=UPI0025976052|nr:alpha/beta hydrolase [uncultured Eubacterium sp.]
MEYEIETAHGRLFCRREGSGPILLLIHGVACDSEFFRETSAILAEKFTVISYDRRGYSRSIAEEGENDFSVWAHAEDAAEIIRLEQKRKAEEEQCPIEAGWQSDGCSADLSTGVFVAGCSAGGAVAAALATKYPELVRQVFLHEPLMRGSGELAAEQDAFWEKLRKSTEKHRIITCMMHFVNAMGGMNREKEGQSLEQQSRNLKNLELFLEKEMDSFSGLKLDDFDISVPVTVACGSDDRTGMFHRSAHQAAEAKGWKYVTVPGYHNFASDEPEAFAKCLTEVFEDEH